MTRATLATGLLLLVALPLRADDAKDKPGKVPFELLKTKHMVVSVKVNGKGPYRLLFDTGAPFTVMSTKVGKEAKLEADDAGGLKLPGFGGLGQPKVDLLEIGDMKVKGTSAMVMDHPTVAIMAKELGEIEGIVGFPFFSRYKMTIDYQAKEMTFTPTNYEPSDVLTNLLGTLMAGQRGPKVVAPVAQWGLVVDKKADDDDAGVTVKEVLPGSAAAAAGLKAGDRLLTIDGRWTDSVTDCYTATSVVKAGTAVPVVVKRDGKDVTVTVTPRNGL